MGLKSKLFGGLKLLRPYAIGGTVLGGICFFLADSSAKDKERRKLAETLTCEREEIRDISKKLDLRSLKKFGRVALKRFGGPGENLGETFVDVEEFAHFLKEYSELENGSDHQKKIKLYPWEILPLFRKSPFKYGNNGENLISLPELLSGISILAASESLDEKLWLLFDSHSSKTENENGDRRENDKMADEKEVAKMFENLVRFRHFYLNGLLKRQSYLPPKFRPFSPSEMADLFFEKIEKIEKKTENKEKKSGGLYNNEMRVVTLKEFTECLEKISRGKQKERFFEFWYLDEKEK